ncbi:MAG: hypothetical protein ACI9VT_003722 [Psychroserpens sp.]|jgi:hypothetical protein
MKSLKRVFFAFAMVLVTAFAATNIFAGESNGIKPVERQGFFCSVIPWFCGVSKTTGNGGGKEPPK